MLCLGTQVSMYLLVNDPIVLLPTIKSTQGRTWNFDNTEQLLAKNLLRVVTHLSPRMR